MSKWKGSAIIQAVDGSYLSGIIYHTGSLVPK